MPARNYGGVRESRGGVRPSSMNKYGAEHDPFDQTLVYDTILRKNGATNEVYDVGTDTVVFSSSDDHAALSYLILNLSANDTVKIDAGTYITEGNGISGTPQYDDMIFTESGITIDARGATIRLDDKGFQVNQMLFAYNGSDNLRIIGGEWDYDKSNNFQGNSPGVQAIFSIRGSNIEISGVTLKNAYNLPIIVDGGAGHNYHHITIDRSDERGIYFSNNNQDDIVVSSSIIKNINAGCIRANTNPDKILGNVRIFNNYLHSTAVGNGSTVPVGVPKVFLIDHVTGNNSIKSNVCVSDYTGETTQFFAYFRWNDPCNWDISGNRFRAIDKAPSFICHNGTTITSLNRIDNTIININETYGTSC